jgi:hypothetical protein
MTRKQHGGIKIIFDTTNPNVMNREIRNLEGIERVFVNTTDIEVVSTSSLNSFVLRLHLNPANILFRSNIFDIKTSRFTRESLTLSRDLFSKKSLSLAPNKAFDQNEGLPVHEIIMKVSIINPGTDSRGIHIRPAKPIEQYNSKNKASLSEQEFSNEYYTQRYLYSSMMSVSGNPFCPDAFGLYVTRQASDETVLSLYPNIQTIASKNPRLQEIMDYLTRHLNANYRIGFIFMESIPRSYRAVFYLSPKADPNYNEVAYKKICEGISAINILTIYRGHIFHLDAHSGNWLCNPVEKLTEQVKAIDFGRVYRINNQANTNTFITQLKENVKRYFQTFSKDPNVVINALNNFYLTLGSNDAEVVQYMNDPNIGQKFSHAGKIIEDEIRRMIDDFNEHEYFSKPYISLSHEERKMNINMIHRITLIYIYVDFFYNCAIYDVTQGQISHIYNIIFQTNILNIGSISNLGLRIEFDTYNEINHNNAMNLLQTYKRIYTILYKFNEDRQFPNIRDYQRFKDFHYTNAQRAWTRIKQFGRAVWENPITKYTVSGISRCSSAVCGPIISATRSVAGYATSKASDAFTSLRSSITGYKPPSITIPKSRASSPPRDYSAAVPVSPIAYGGFRSSRTKRAKYQRKRNIHKYTKKH